MQLHTIDTGFFKLDGGAMFGVVPKSLWQRTNPADEKNLCTWATRLLLIEDGSRLILVDTGLGDKQDAKFFGHYDLHGDDTLDKSLAKYGYNRQDITDVFLTHLHFDHCGGAIVRDGDKLIPSFANATYWSNEKHWNWATVDPNPREKASFLAENILPIQESGQLRFIGEGQALTEHIDIRIANGHTEAMMLPQIRYKGKTILYMADLLPSVGHIPIPYVMSYDVRPLTTMQERKSYWEEIADQEYILFLEHDPVNECCTLQHTEKGIRLKDTFRLSDI
ncbi:MBL fold metallo-hydrolase [Sphingobacterium spiritivorum]|uniref:Metallo-beta-lactamase domain protein n=1 Tax=Sphingobacterium spiritivorum ATCC 33861 TaxID=525373 RepID=D7VRG3_SPHSI|nr:MBL fold metallo-hydrolase [Sphingobacterium spiritivorum]EFK56364.1 metallo-beta-lactamase domain protein [Sphingobacterium spiritivorum ATCC 33861]QQT35555.1 MBL fold metallo-hydrolase [Sphingobacterium spiritivorum]WQD32252.1 MBL fold metallo-hydrolase [Sphingobacterium spiritivorum]SUJ07103.1 Metallo-beta-lactamase superfamily [Sphingobacterium spiritivorum]